MHKDGFVASLKRDIGKVGAAISGKKKTANPAKKSKATSAADKKKAFAAANAKRKTATTKKTANPAKKSKAVSAADKKKAFAAANAKRKKAAPKKTTGKVPTVTAKGPVKTRGNKLGQSPATQKKIAEKNRAKASAAAAGKKIKAAVNRKKPKAAPVKAKPGKRQRPGLAAETRRKDALKRKRGY